MISFTLLLNPRLPGMKWRCCIERYPPICPICRASWLTETTMYAKWINMGKINFDSYNVNIWIASAKHSLLLFRVDLMLCWHKWWGETKNSRNVAMRNKCYVGGIPAAASKSAESVVVIQSMMLGKTTPPPPSHSASPSGHIINYSVLLYLRLHPCVPYLMQYHHLLCICSNFHIYCYHLTHKYINSCSLYENVVRIMNCMS